VFHHFRSVPGFEGPVGVDVLRRSRSGSLLTRRWGRESRANSSLKPNSLLAGSLQGISGIM
jgi:hypothetical protein